MHTLFVCTGNMCRSPLAERLGRLHYPQHHWESAGVLPQGLMHPLSQAVLRELGADASNFMARHVRELDLAAFNQLVLIGESARLHTPDTARQVTRHYWDIADPFGAEGSREEQLAVYRATAAQLEQRIHELVSQSLAL